MNLTDKQIYQSRIEQLQQWLRDNDVQFFLLPRSDRYQQEFLPPENETLQWLTGFSGSNGFVCITPEQCLLASDTRYSIQMKQEVPDSVICYDGALRDVEKYLRDNVQTGDRIAFPEWQLTINAQQNFANIASEKEACLIGFADNPIDRLWLDRKTSELSPAYLLDAAHHGHSAGDKINQLRHQLQEEKCTANLISDLSMIAWLLNLRGSDIPYTPVNIALLMVSADEAILYIDPQKLQPHIIDNLKENHITITAYDDFEHHLPKFKQQNILLDPYVTPYYFKQIFSQAECQIHELHQPLQSERAIKNSAEQSAIMEAHRQDGIAMVRLLHWLEGQTQTSEIAIAEKLAQYRALGKDYQTASFATIAGFAEHSAIIHYHATEQTNKTIDKTHQPTVLLLDSGGHYRTGTTDITRTIPFGHIDNPHIINDYSLVLKAHINLAKQIFPAGANGSQLDAICRAPLWQAGKNYQHGTGHGVGMCLDVHEGPYHISPRSDLPIKTGILFSNEPGCYHENQYGIRIENLVLVQQHPTHHDSLYLQTVTLCPINLTLIDKKLLNHDEIAWLNDYHQLVFDTLSVDLSDEPELYAWLKNATYAL